MLKMEANLCAIEMDFENPGAEKYSSILESNILFKRLNIKMC